MPRLELPTSDIRLNVFLTILQPHFHRCTAEGLHAGDDGLGSKALLINFFILLITLFLFCGLALDVGMLQLRKLQLQHAADAAALGAMLERARGGSGWVAAGKADATLNGFTDGINGVVITIQSPPTSGTYSGDNAAVQAIVKQSVHPAFMGLVGGGTANPASTAVARAQSSSACVYIMNAAASTFYPLTIQGFTGVYSVCDLYVDSSNKSIENDSGSTLSVTGGKKISVQGSASGALMPGTTSPTPIYNSTNQNDPLGSVISPAFSSCTYYNTVVGNWLLGWLFPTTQTLNPGTYCGGITTYYSHITFNPGLYIITGGMNWNNSTYAGSGVMFFLTQGGGSGYGTFVIQSSTVNLSAPTTTSGGASAGVIFFGDRNWSAPGSQGVQINSSSVTTDGVWYVVNTGIYNNSSTLQGNKYLGIVTDNLKLWAATVNVPSPDYSALAAGSPYGGGGSGLVQ